MLGELNYYSQFGPAAIIGLVSVLGLYVLGRNLEPRVDPQEPRYAKSAIPLVGHIIGFLNLGNRYLERLVGHDGIRTINLGWTRAYVVTSLDLTAAVRRQSATISMSPVVKMMAECLSNFEPDLLRRFDPDSSRVGKDTGLAKDTITEYHRAFGPGAGSASLQITMLNEVIRLTELCMTKGPGAQDQEPLEMYSWLKHTVTQASMASIYGPQHPFRDPVVEKAFWTFELECGPLLLNNFASRLLASKAIKARDVLDKAFAVYYTSNAKDDASELAWARYQPPASYGIKPRDIARLEGPFLFAVLATSVPTSFWAFVEIHRHGNLLAEVREELSLAITADDADDGVPNQDSEEKKRQRRFIVHVERLKTSCPLILSIFQETLRHLSVFSLFRIVTNDTMLAGRYLLKAGTLLMMPNNVIHNSAQHWGENAAEFDPYRFMPDNGKIPSSHFRAFGEAPFRCPGRHFATTEIISILCILLMRFDFEPQGSSENVHGEWNLPRPYLAVYSAIVPPKTDVTVKVRPRKGWQGDWSFELGDPKAKFPLVVG